MPRAPKSQWDFGELFPPEQTTRKVVTVSELTWQLKRLLEKEIGQVWVTGEATNLRAQASGHLYFTLKDAGAQLNCLLFRGEQQVDRSLLADGHKLIVRGELTVYEPRGQYQLRVTGLELQGLGALQAAFEKLKQKLKAEGLFAEERKRPLPRFPRRMGLVTSPTGAAIKDVLHVIRRRNPALEVVLAPCRVQGDGAALEIASAIGLLNDFDSQMSGREQTGAELGEGRYLDLILVTRGGGSLEDLWAFNEEVVARAIFQSHLPVVSAVGHEIDFTISDFVADLRAATPSAAAELITEGVFSSGRFIAEAQDRLRQLCRQQLAAKVRWFAQDTQRLARVHPRRRLNDLLQRADDLQSTLQRCTVQAVHQQTTALQNLAARLSRLRPAVVLRQRGEVLLLANRRLTEQAHHRLREWQNRLAQAETRLRLLGPEQVLARGYSITSEAKTGKVLRDPAEVSPGQQIRTRLSKGEILSEVRNLKPDVRKRRGRRDRAFRSP
jgi:exodeoxyribonuclease VII large subunit